MIVLIFYPSSLLIPSVPKYFFNLVIFTEVVLFVTPKRREPSMSVLFCCCRFLIILSSFLYNCYIHKKLYYCQIDFWHYKTFLCFNLTLIWWVRLRHDSHGYVSLLSWLVKHWWHHHRTYWTGLRIIPDLVGVLICDDSLIPEMERC